jgi:serine protease Do
VKRFIALLSLLAFPACARDGDQLYDQSVSSVVWLSIPGKHQEIGTGTGVMVGESLILTAYHVVAGESPVWAYLPRRHGDGSVINSATAYRQEGARRCLVIRTDPKRDLALLRVCGEVKGSKMALARKSPAPGEAVFSIGNGDNLLFRHSAGSVRGVYEGTAAFPEHDVSARVIEMTAPINLGDSGAPVINRHGELIGINSWIETGENQTHLAIDIEEIRQFLGVKR